MLTDKGLFDWEQDWFLVRDHTLPGAAKPGIERFWVEDDEVYGLLGDDTVLHHMKDTQTWEVVPGKLPPDISHAD